MRAIHFDEPGRRRVAVLCGGESHEREISLQSGRAVADGLARVATKSFAWIRR